MTLDLAAGPPDPYSPSVFTHFTGSFHHVLDLAARRPGPYSPGVFNDFTGSMRHFKFWTQPLGGPVSNSLTFSLASPVHFIILDTAAGWPGPYSPSVFTCFTNSSNHHFGLNRWAAWPLLRLPWRSHLLHRFIPSFWT